MSIFNFRRGRPSNAKASSKSSPKATAESLEVVRKRARQRLIGSAVLVLAGVVGFPLIFDTQPRPVPVDIAIEIPSRSAVKPASPVPPVTRSEPAPASAPAPAAQVAEAAAPAAAVNAQASLHEKEEIVESPPAAARPAEPAAAPKAEAPRAPVKPETKADAKPEPKHEARHESKPKADDGQRAKALLEGGAEGRVVVQVGAFSDAAKAREVRAKLEKAGLKTYTQVTETKDGKRIRVRVGPYATKSEADKAVTKVKSLDLPAAVLTL